MLSPRQTYQEIASTYQRIAAQMHDCAIVDMKLARMIKDGRTSARYRRETIKDQRLAARYSALALDYLLLSLEAKS